jgi:predicted enzyme related to lactoylglutathione lyase
VRQAGATVVAEPHEVGPRVRVATVRDPGGTLLGLIENAER